MTKGTWVAVPTLPSTLVRKAYNSASVAIRSKTDANAFDDTIRASLRASMTYDHSVNQLLEYLRRAAAERAISWDTATQAWNIWLRLNEIVSERLSVPDAAPALGGQLIYTWDRGEHHLEVEIFPDAPSEFFYLNRETDEDWAADYIIGNAFPGELIEKLQLFIIHDLPAATSTTPTTWRTAA